MLPSRYLPVPSLKSPSLNSPSMLNAKENGVQGGSGEGKGFRRSREAVEFHNAPAVMNSVLPLAHISMQMARVVFAGVLGSVCGGSLTFGHDGPSSRCRNHASCRPSIRPRT